MGMRETYQRTHMRALVIAGDEVELASRLEVPVQSLVNSFELHSSASENR